MKLHFIIRIIGLGDLEFKTSFGGMETGGRLGNSPSTISYPFELLIEPPVAWCHCYSSLLQWFTVFGCKRFYFEAGNTRFAIFKSHANETNLPWKSPSNCMTHGSIVSTQNAMCLINSFVANFWSKFGGKTVAFRLIFAGLSCDCSTAGSGWMQIIRCVYWGNYFRRETINVMLMHFILIWFCVWQFVFLVSQFMSRIIYGFQKASSKNISF